MGADMRVSPSLFELERTLDAARLRARETHRACKRIEGTKRHGSPEHLRRVLEATRATVAYNEAQLARSKAALRMVEELMAETKGGSTTSVALKVNDV